MSITRTTLQHIKSPLIRLILFLACHATTCHSNQQTPFLTKGVYGLVKCAILHHSNVDLNIADPYVVTICFHYEWRLVSINDCHFGFDECSVESLLSSSGADSTPLTRVGMFAL